MPCFIEEMLPRQVVEKVHNPGIFFLPVSPLIEWHSFHLPLGVDGLISEGVSRALAEEFNALCCRCLPIALDEFRDPKTKKQWGLPENADVFGMNFPDLPLTSEYHTPDLMYGMVTARLKALKHSGIRSVFLVNHHGGAGQRETLEEIANIFSDDSFCVTALAVPPLNTFHEDGERALYLKAGGHAGLSETIQTLAFRPDLVDLSQLPAGELSVAESGILHGKPTIPAELNPHFAAQDLAEKWRTSVLKNGAKKVREVCGL